MDKRIKASEAAHLDIVIDWAALPARLRFRLFLTMLRAALALINPLIGGHSTRASITRTKRAEISA